MITVKLQPFTPAYPWGTRTGTARSPIRWSLHRLSISCQNGTQGTKEWKTEYAKLTAERKMLNQRYLALKEEVKEAEKSERAFIVSCSRNSSLTESRIWSDNR